MKLDEIKLRDMTGARVKFTTAELTDLALLVHDKRHVLSKYRGTSSALEKALTHFSELSPPLWRGIYPEEEKLLGVGKIFSTQSYMSMSENKNIAQAFAHGTKKLLHMQGVLAFPYWKFNIEHLQLPAQKKDPVAFARNDGQYMLDSLKSEAEWIIARNTSFEVVSQHNDGDFMIYEVRKL